MHTPHSVPRHLFVFLGSKEDYLGYVAEAMTSAPKWLLTLICIAVIPLWRSQ